MKTFLLCLIVLCGLCVDQAKAWQRVYGYPSYYTNTPDDGWYYTYYCGQYYRTTYPSIAPASSAPAYSGNGWRKDLGNWAGKLANEKQENDDYISAIKEYGFSGVANGYGSAPNFLTGNFGYRPHNEQGELAYGYSHSPFTVTYHEISQQQPQYDPMEAFALTARMVGDAGTLYAAGQQGQLTLERENNAALQARNDTLTFGSIFNSAGANAVQATLQARQLKQPETITARFSSSTGDAPEVPQANPQLLTLIEHTNKIIKTNCIGCHDAKNKSFNMLAAGQSRAKLLEESVKAGNRMRLNKDDPLFMPSGMEPLNENDIVAIVQRFEAQAAAANH